MRRWRLGLPISSWAPPARFSYVKSNASPNVRDSRMRRWIACCTVFALLSTWTAPAGAQQQSETPEALQALAIMDHSCGMSARELKSKLPSVKSLLARAGHRSYLVAQNEGEPSPAPAAGSPSPQPYETVFPSETVLPSPQPTQGLPPLQRAPIGPGVLPPPTVPPATATPAPPGTPTPSPTPSSSPTGPVPVNRMTGPPPTITPKALATATPFPTTSPSPTPTAAPTIAPLKPGQVLIISDKFQGSTRSDEPQDFEGHVNLFYDQGIIVADHAHYDGKRYLDFTGNPYLRNYSGDTVLRSEIIRFDRITQQATLLKGNGETSEGVERGLLYFKANTMKSLSNGYTTGNNAFWTTCQNPHGGYHMEARTFELRPNDKLIARKVTVYLGPLAVFYIPVLVISLASRHLPRQSSFLPLVGYDQAEGFWIKTRFGFGTTPNFFGYYRVEYFTKLGLGLGVNFTIGTRNHRRQQQLHAQRSRDSQLPHALARASAVHKQLWTVRHGPAARTHVGRQLELYGKPRHGTADVPALQSGLAAGFDEPGLHGDRQLPFEHHECAQRLLNAQLQLVCRRRQLGRLGARAGSPELHDALGALFAELRQDALANAHRNRNRAGVQLAAARALPQRARRADLDAIPLGAIHRSAAAFFRDARPVVDEFRARRRTFLEQRPVGEPARPAVRILDGGLEGHHQPAGNLHDPLRQSRPQRNHVQRGEFQRPANGAVPELRRHRRQHARRARRAAIL